MSPPAPAARALLAAAPRAGWRALVAFAFYAPALALWTGSGLLAALASPPGLALLVGGGLLLLAGAAGALLADGAALPRLARALLLAGAGLSATAGPASLLLRETRARVVMAGDRLGPRDLPGLPELTFGRVEVAPRGPHLLSKTVTAAATLRDGSAVEIGLFPPARLGPWRLSVIRYGFAPSIRWTDASGRTRGGGVVPMGALPHDAEEAALPQWTPEPDVMMGAGTYPPKLEEVLAAGRGDRLFLRLTAATLAGERRDLRDAGAWRWLADGPPGAPEFEVLLLRGSERLDAVRLAAGERAPLGDGVIAIAPAVELWAEILAARDPWLPWAVAGLALLAAGGALAAGLRISRWVRRDGAAPAPRA